MIPLAEARRFVLGSCRVLPVVEVALAEALGCVSARPVVAEVAVPAFANSSMDGYAVRAQDTSDAPVELAVVGTTLAGSGPGTLGAGQAVRLMTGAPLPEGADAVCMLEITEEGAGSVLVREPVEPGTFVRRPGDDLAAGTEAFPAGTALGPGHLGVLASLGLTSVAVHRRPTVGVLSSGDELVAPPAALGPGQIRDANRPALLALVDQAGWRPVDLGAVPDEESAIEGALLDGASRCDAVVVSGGVSVGDADLVKVVLERASAGTMRWLQVAIKPAKPFAFGLLAPGVPVFGVPGNPVSAMVSFELFARPALRLMAGHQVLDRPVARARADEALLRPVDGKTHFFRVRAEVGHDGRLHVRGTGLQQSHVLSAMALANALAVVPDGPGVAAGGEVEVLLLDSDGLGRPTSSWAGPG